MEPAPPRHGFAAALAKAAANEEVLIWPENWQVWSLFADLRTQWSVGMGGRTGLQYLVLFDMLDRLGLEPAEWRQAFEDIQTMELAALAAMHEED